MAIYHCSVKVISRSSGRSAVGASAYRSGESLYNERDGITHDYTRKSGIEHQEILAPDQAPEWAHDREQLWNRVELTERRKDSQLAREVEVALPNELSKEARIELVRAYAKNFTEQGMVADIAIHDKGDGNPHAHILLTMRTLETDGFGQKAREWNNKQHIEQWRENWSKQANHYLAKEGHQERIDHRSHAERGMATTPTKHEGHIVRAMELRGIKTEIGDLNRQILEENKMLTLIDKQISHYERSLEHERIRVNGTENRGVGVKGGHTETLTDILIQSHAGAHQINSGRTAHLDKSSQQSYRGPGREQEGSGRERGTSQGAAQDDRGESQWNLQGHQAGDERALDKQQREIGADAHQVNESNIDSRDQLQRNPENTDRIDLPGQADPHAHLEGQSEAVRVESGHNDGPGGGPVGGVSTGNPLNDVLKGLEDAIRRANAIERAEADRQSKALEKRHNKSKEKSHSKGRPQDLSR